MVVLSEDDVFPTQYFTESDRFFSCELFICNKEAFKWNGLYSMTIQMESGRFFIGIVYLQQRGIPLECPFLNDHTNGVWSFFVCGLQKSL